MAPAPVSVAPGQVATFYVAGLYLAVASTPTPVTSSTSSFGITAAIQQDGTSTPAPVQSVRPVSLCPDGTIVAQITCGSLLAVTVQIPYELVPVCPLCARPVSAVPPLLVFSASGQTPTAIGLNPLADEVRVLTACDVALGQPLSPTMPNGLPCAPLVTHTDGSLVSASSPASVGEALTAWTLGLGQTTPGCRYRSARQDGSHCRDLQSGFQLSSERASHQAVHRGARSCAACSSFCGRCARIRGAVPSQLCRASCPAKRDSTMRVAFHQHHRHHCGPERGPIQPHGEHRRSILIRRRRDLRGDPDPSGLSHETLKSSSIQKVNELCCGKAYFTTPYTLGQRASYPGSVSRMVVLESEEGGQ